MRIPEIRKRLIELSKVPPQLWSDEYAAELALLAEETRRRVHKSPARAVAASMTPELIDQIKAFAGTHTGLTMHQIGLRFGVNQGRVSEAIYGKRDLR